MERPTGHQGTPAPLSRDEGRAAVVAAAGAEPAVLAAYLFGSVARGAAGPLSDLDVAVLLDEPADDQVVGRFGNALCRRPGTDRIDVIAVQGASVPLRKALLLPRVSLFIADDVGLGKTIEAGLIVRELLMRQRVRRIVVAAPPSVVLQ